MCFQEVIELIIIGFLPSLSLFRLRQETNPVSETQTFARPPNHFFQNGEYIIDIIIVIVVIGYYFYILENEESNVTGLKSPVNVFITQMEIDGNNANFNVW